jgi:hypothetical protein
MKSTVNIRLDNDMLKLLKKRAKSEFLRVEELIEDIVRRSMVSYVGKPKTGFKVDDKLVGMFSRERRGRPGKKKKKPKPKSKKTIKNK